MFMWLLHLLLSVVRKLMWLRAQGRSRGGGGGGAGRGGEEPTVPGSWSQLVCLDGTRHDPRVNGSLVTPLKVTG